MDHATNNIDLNNRRKKKFTGGNASKRHRDRVNVEFNNLAQLLPFPESVIAKLDKSSILRLAVSYIRAKSFFKGASMKTLRRETLSSLIKEGTGAVTQIFSKALDGFLLVLTEDMKVLFVSESVRDYLGYCQAGIIHENFLQFVNPLDHGVAQSSVKYQQTESSACADRKNVPNESDMQDSLPPVARRFVCRMKCAFSCSSRFYTAYRSFQFSGHLRKSSIQEGRQEKTVNTLVVFATPLNNNENASSTAPQKKEKETRSSISLRKELNSYDTYTSGFRIEPTLRPHVTPILVTSQEHSEICAANSMTMETTKPVKSEEIPSKPPPDLPPLIKTERYSPLFLSKNVYRENVTVEQFYSDQSDDSKFSPVSSPDLLWKRKHYKEERYLPYSKSTNRDTYWLNIEQPSIEEKDYIYPSVLTRREARLELPRRETRSTSPRINHHYVSLASYPSEHKRHFIETRDDFHSNKRKKFDVVPVQKNSKFDINSLLGLDDSTLHYSSYKNKPY